MALSCFGRSSTLLVLLLAIVAWTASVSADPDPLHDIASAKLTAADFKIANLTGTGAFTPAGSASGTSTAAMPGAASEGTSMVVFKIARKGLVTPHWHPRATELFFVVQGSASVSFLDSNNAIKTNTFTAGDAGVLPRALLHWMQNIGKNELIITSALNGEDAGAIFTSLSTAALPKDILKATFGITSKETKYFTSPSSPIVFY